ncbi:MAG: hypothetical protein JW909_01610 [Planctomycetes bacterium]|nr:hypothetical protein [Planctomycetota bacterium]
MGICRAVACFSVVIVLLSGCGDRARRQTTRAIATFQLNERDARMAFGRGRVFSNVRGEELDEYIDNQIVRLSGAGWEEGWEALKTLGAPAVEKLIPLLNDDKTETYVMRSPVPGIVYVDEAPHITLGELAYSLLNEMLVQYSNYGGRIPLRDRSAWESWWKTDGRSVKFNAFAAPKG